MAIALAGLCVSRSGPGARAAVAVLVDVQVPHELCNLKGWPTPGETELVRLFYIFILEILCFFSKRMFAFNVCTDLLAWLVRNCHLKKSYFYSSRKMNTVKCIIHNFGTKEASGSVLIFIRRQGHLLWGRCSKRPLEWPASVSGYKWFFFLLFSWCVSSVLTHPEGSVKEKDGRMQVCICKSSSLVYLIKPSLGSVS